MKQLDLNVSPPANIMTFRLTLTQVTIDLDPHATLFKHLSYKILILLINF